MDLIWVKSMVFKGCGLKVGIEDIPSDPGLAPDIQGYSPSQLCISKDCTMYVVGSNIVPLDRQRQDLPDVVVVASQFRAAPTLIRNSLCL